MVPVTPAVDHLSLTTCHDLAEPECNHTHKVFHTADHINKAVWDEHCVHVKRLVQARPMNHKNKLSQYKQLVYK